MQYHHHYSVGTQFYAGGRHMMITSREAAQDAYTVQIDGEPHPEPLTAAQIGEFMRTGKLPYHGTLSGILEQVLPQVSDETRYNIQKLIEQEYPVKIVLTALNSENEQLRQEALRLQQTFSDIRQRVESFLGK